MVEKYLVKVDVDGGITVSEGFKNGDAELAASKYHGESLIIYKRERNTFVPAELEGILKQVWQSYLDYLQEDGEIDVEFPAVIRFPTGESKTLTEFLESPITNYDEGEVITYNYTITISVIPII